jgi:predicted kinase
VARDNLKLRHVVIADCVNDVNITRDAWRDLALGIKVTVLEVEVLCSDVTEQRRRIEQRVPDIPNFRPPTWQTICNRRSEPWPREHIVIETVLPN